jgi:membrane protein
MYLSAYIFLVGAELNSEIEHQTAKDSTTGRPRPIGTRGAWAADNVAVNPDPDEQVASDEAAPSLGAAGPPLPSKDDSTT